MKEQQHSPTQEELLQRIAALEARVNETEEERLARVDKEWRAAQAVAARASQINSKRNLVAKLDRRLAALEPWRTFLRETREAVTRELAEAKESLTKSLDTHARYAAEQRVQILKETLRDITAGTWRSSGGDLYARAAQAGIPAAALNERFGLSLTEKWHDELQADRDKAQGELDALLSK